MQDQPIHVHPIHYQPTNFLRAHRGLVSQTILVNFDLAGCPFSVESGSHEHFGEVMRSPAFQLD